MSEPRDDDPREQERAARKQAMDLLARREHARAELAAKLGQRGYAAHHVSVVLDELVAEGLLSDARYAAAMITSKAARGYGPLHVFHALRQAGVVEAEITTALDEAGVDWFTCARQARRKRFGHATPGDYPGKAKQMRFLQRRGFDMDQIMAAFEDGPDE